jgi:hypothetical protein
MEREVVMSRSRGGVKRTISAFSLGAAVAVSPLPLRAAERPAGSPLVAGDRVRLSARTIAKVTTGRLLEVGPDGLKIQLADRPDPIEVPLTSVTRLERSLGRRSSAGKGALIGTLVGAGAGAALVVAASGSDSDCDGPCAGYAAVLGAAFAGAGALVGAISGALITTERWEAVSLGHIGVSMAPRPRGAALAVSVRF